MNTIMAENTPNHDLFLRALDGDQDACESLLYRHRSRLQAWLRSRIGPGLRHQLDVEDVLQGTFSKAIESLHTFEYRDEPSLFRWLCAIGERVILKAAKRDREIPGVLFPPGRQGPASR
jgi:RNA polymerase sigma-70 factor (ECF subfamily)